MSKRKTLPSILRDFRVSHNLTFAALSIKTGIPIATLFQIEKGARKPNERTLYRLSQSVPGIEAE